jgi:hypothetical protein
MHLVVACVRACVRACGVCVVLLRYLLTWSQFKSHRLHHTDECHWKKGYINRRINLTLLFGKNNWKQYDI